MGFTSHSLDHICAPALLALRLEPSAKYLLKASPREDSSPGPASQHPELQQWGPFPAGSMGTAGGEVNRCPLHPRPHLLVNNRPARAPLSLCPLPQHGRRSVSSAKRGPQGSCGHGPQGS